MLWGKKYKMIKFEKKYLYTFADVEDAEKLIGKKGIFFDDILDVSDLKTLMLDELISLSGDDCSVGLCFESIVGNFRYFYYDPNLECKRAYVKGKTIQTKNIDNEWVDCDSNPGWLTGLEYRIKPETETPLTNWQVAEWVAKGEGQVLHLGNVMTDFYYGDTRDNEPCAYKIRKWSDSEWHEATKEYIGGVK
jgi:hypothetical protein